MPFLSFGSKKNTKYTIPADEETLTHLAGLTDKLFKSNSIKSKDLQKARNHFLIDDKKHLDKDQKLCFEIMA